MDPFVKAIAGAAGSAALAAGSGGTSLIPSILGLGGSLASGLMGWQSTRQTNDAQIRLAKLQNQFQLDAMRENNEFNRKMAFDMFDYESNYNSPLQQMQRLKEAGLNPAVGMAGNLGSSGNTSAAAPSAAGSGVSPVMPSLSVPGSPFQGAFDNLEAISRIFANVSAAKKQGAETSEIFATLDGKVKQLFADANMKQVQADYNSTLNEIAQIEKQFKGVKGIAELRNMYADYVVKMTEGKYKDAEAELKKIQGLVEDENLKILREQHPFLVDNVKKLGQKIDAETHQAETGAKANEAAARASDASAAKSWAEVKTINEVRPEVKRQAIALADETAALAKKSGAEAELAWRTISSHVDKLLADLKLTKAQTKYYRSQFDIAIKKRDWYDFSMIQASLAPLTGVITGIANTVGHSSTSLPPE